MRGPAAAMAWQFRLRHRWGLLAVVAAVAAVATIKVGVLRTQTDVGSDMAFAFLVMVPLAAASTYLLAVFTFGVSGDVAARESMYPPRMFALPVSSRALAGWPMLFGCTSIAVLWLAMRLAGVWPRDVYVPAYWPALFGASLLAWTQALMWMPYPLRGMRIVVAIALLISIDVVVFTAMEMRAAESTMLLLLAPLLPLAYAAAVSAVSRARRGDIPEWPNLSARLVRTSSSRLREFSSAANAQLWFEWRQHGRTLPIMVAIVLPFGLSLLFIFRETPVIVFEIIAAALVTPLVMATFVAATVAKSSVSPSDSYGITPFVATRPVEDRTLVSAKWRAALLSTLAAWTVVAIAVPVALTWSDAWEPIVNIVRQVNEALGRPRAIVLGLLVLASLAGATWKQLVQGLYIGMSGREWAVKGSVFATLVLATVAFPIVGWILDSRTRIVRAWEAIPWLMAALVALKLVLAMRVMQRGMARGLFTRKQLLLGAIAWDVCVLALFGVMTWMLPAILFRRYALLLVAILVVPFVRLAAAPVAVAGNRHR